MLVYTFFFADSSERKSVQALYAGSVAALLVTSLLVISFFENPYHKGSGSLSPTSMQQTHLPDGRGDDCAEAARSPSPAMRRAARRRERTRSVSQCVKNVLLITD